MSRVTQLVSGRAKTTKPGGLAPQPTFLAFMILPLRGETEIRETRDLLEAMASQ